MNTEENITYKTFIRSCNNWQEFSTAEKADQSIGLTFEEARQECAEFNKNRTQAEIEAGTKMEFEQE